MNNPEDSWRPQQPTAIDAPNLGHRNGIRFQISASIGRMAKRINRLVARYRLMLRQLKLSRARKLLAAVLGGSVVLAGIAMIVLPGPAVLVIPLGVAILATEFLWARRVWKQARGMLRDGSNVAPGQRADRV